MTIATTTDFRQHMSDYLDMIKKWEILYLWRRKKKEFVILPIELIDEEDVEMLRSTYLSTTVSDRRAEPTLSLDDIQSSLSDD